MVSPSHDFHFSLGDAHYSILGCFYYCKLSFPFNVSYASLYSTAPIHTVNLVCTRPFSSFIVPLKEWVCASYLSQLL